MRGGGLNHNFFLSISFSWVNLRLHTENQLHVMPGRTLKVCVGAGGWWVVLAVMLKVNLVIALARA
jgi:hypothetical protein